MGNFSLKTNKARCLPCLPRGVLVASLLLVIQLKVLRALEHVLNDGLAVGALELQDNLLCRLGLLVENGLRLTAITGLFAVVTPFAARIKTCLASLVLHNLKALMRVATCVRAMHRLLLRVVHHLG
ncbi:hypothetical protein TcG_03302, partial [Trypanosoma cruzi]